MCGMPHDDDNATPEDRLDLAISVPEAINKGIAQGAVFGGGVFVVWMAGLAVYYLIGG